jgi:hypothetical protein
MLRVYCYKTMTIEKTYKLTIKDAAYFLTEQEVTALYEQCRQALNISVTNPNCPTYPPGVRKFDPVVPTYPNWPTDDNTTPGKPDQLPNTYCGNVQFVTIHRTDNSVMDGGGGISTANVPSSKGINFLSDDMETIKENNNWRSSVQKALDKLSVKTNVTTSDGTTIR